MRWLGFALALGGTACRGYHERHETGDTAVFDCQPYALECADCTLGATLALPDPLRHWRCDDPTFGELTAVRHRAEGDAADDEHYYDADGLRVAARRVHDEPVPVCDAATLREDEWWGVVLACAASCEVDPALPEADPALPACG